VEGVVPGTPAEEAGFRGNDIITRLDDAIITGPAELRVQLKKHKTGDTVNLTYLRGGQTKTVAVKLGHQTEGKMMFGDRDVKRKLIMEGPPWDWKFQEGGKKKVAYAGIVTQSLSEGLAAYFKVKKGALISEVVSDSPAEKAGLKAGDVIVKIGEDEIEDEDDVGEAVREHDPGDALDFVIQREGREMTFKVTLGETTRWGSLVPGMAPEAPEPPDAPMTRIYLPQEEELEQLSKKLEKLQIEICVPQPPSAPHAPRAVRISNGGDHWQESFDNLRDRLGDTFDRLRRQLETLKAELHDLAQRLHLATA
jgi:C-terminal processing protease CtpA/Prc